MKKFNKTFLFILLFMSCFICRVEAKDSYAKCWYNNDDIYFYYNMTKNTFEYSMASANGYHYFSTSIVKSNFIDKETDKLFCPNIYISTGTYNARAAMTNAHIKKEKDTDRLLEPSKKEIENAETSNTKICRYTSDTNNIEFTLDTSANKILSVAVNSIEAWNNEFSYNEIYDGTNCINVDKIYASCYDGSRGGPSGCGVVKDNPYQGTGSSTSQASLDDGDEDQNSSTSATDSGGGLPTCDVIPPIIKDWIKNILLVVRYVALALVIVLGALDFIKAAGSGEPEQMKKSGQTFLKRVIAVAVLFLLPVLIDLLLNLIELLGADPNCVDISSY